jgi:hypothetical protein
LTALLLLLAALVTPGPASAAGEEPATDRAARRPAGTTATEYWDLTARFDSGHRLFARFMITDLGPGSQNTVAIGHLILPNGTIHRFRNALPGGGGSLQSDGLKIDVANSHLDMSGPEYRLHIDKGNTQIDLRFAPRGHPATPAAAAPDGYHFEILDTAAPIAGTIWHRRKIPEPLEVSGRVAISHTWSENDERDVVLRRIEFFSLEDDGAIQLTAVTTPNGEQTRWLTVRDPDENFYQTSEFEIDLPELASNGDGACYPVPASLEIRGAGLEGRVKLERTFLEHDPLDALPLPVRLLVRVSMRPHRVWTAAPFEITLATAPGGPPRKFRGSGVAVVTYLNPARRPCDEG